MLLLAKIHTEKYINDMYFNEYLYFKALRDFRGRIKELSGRVDPKELNIKNEQISFFSIYIDNQEIASSKISPEFNAQFMEFLDDPNINSCSLCSMDVELDQNISEFDEKLYELGDKMLVIFDHIKFFEILDQSVENQGYQYSRKFVTYYDPKNFSGDLTLHHKDVAFEYQKEYRILISPTENQPIKISLPGLKNISLVVATKDIKSLTIRKT